MLTIKRTCTNKIITQAIAYGDQPLTAILPKDANDCIYSNDSDELQALLNQNANAFVVFNQHSEARSRVDELETDDEQIIIEIRQETRGVLGLKAQYKKNRPDETLELHYL